MCSTDRNGILVNPRPDVASLKVRVPPECADAAMHTERAHQEEEELLKS